MATAHHNAETDKHYLLGIYNDEDVLLDAVEHVRKKGVKIYEVFTPYPIHGLEHALGYKRSFMPRAAFAFGALGNICAILLQTTIMGIDWPMIIGGKSFIAIPNFIPVIFECTVLFAAFGMVGTFLVTNSLYPHKVPRIFDRRSTDDKHIVAIDLAKNTLSEAEIRNILIESGVEKHTSADGTEHVGIKQRNFTDEENKGSFIRYLADLIANGVTSSNRAIKTSK